MLSFAKRYRPDCEEILKRRNDWSLSWSEIKNDFNALENKSDETFHSNFIKMKSQ